MNIETRKLLLIEDFLRISDERVLSELETLVKAEKNKLYKKRLKPMKLDEFHDMIDQSINDVKEGKVISHQDLKKKVKTWK
jgi:hypothetical protein